MSWVGHLQGHSQMDRVFGPDFMAAMCQLSVERGYRHFLYGGEPGVAELLKKAPKEIPWLAGRRDVYAPIQKSDLG